MKNFIFLLLFLFSQFTFAQNLKIPQLNAILNSQLVSNDVTVVSDISANESKKLSIGELDKRWQWTATSPLLKTGSENSVLSIPLATGSVSGYLSSADWTTFNNKVGTSTVQVITNKDIDGGTASNTSRITLPKDTKTNLDALTRKAGTIVYDTTSNKPYFDNGTTLTVIGSGSGGGKNYITGGDAESGTTGFATYNDAAGTTPVDGTGGSPSVTWTTSNSSPLENANSFLLTKGATNRQGDGVRYAFTIDTQDRAKVLNISFNYLVNSGTFVAGTSSTASDVTIWIYDVTNAQIIQPSSINLLSNNTSIADRFSATFQTASNSSSYRLIFHVGSTSASAYTLKIDDIKVGPSNYVFGTPLTDWASYTPTGSWVSNTTYSGRWMRSGDSLLYYFRLALSGAPTATGLTVNFLPPNVGQIDTAKMLGTATNGSVKVGDCHIYAAAGVYYGSLYYNGTSSVGPVVINAASTYATIANLNTTVPATFTSGDSVECYNSKPIPIVGWSSSVQMSDQTDMRVVSFSAFKSGGNQNGASGVLSFTSAQDTHGAFNLAAGTFTVPVAGDYQFTAVHEWAATQTVGFGIFVNGTLSGGYSSNASAFYGNISAFVKNLKAGDVISVRSTTGSVLNLNNFYFSGFRISGPSAIAATESLNLRYTSTAGQSLASGNTTLSFATKDYDSHGAFSSNTTFTAPSAGKYSIKAKLSSNTISGLSANYLRILVNGSSVSEAQFAMTYATASNFTYPISDTIKLNAGDAVTIQFQNGFGSTVTAVTTAGANSLAIERVGN